MHFKVLVSGDLTRTLPLSETLVSLLMRRILKVIPSENPYALIFDDIIDRKEGRITSGALFLIIVAKISA